MSNLKKIYIDLETTGVDKDANGIHQIAGIVEMNDQQMEAFDFKVSPFPSDVINDEALKTSGVDREKIKQYQPPGLVFAKFKKLLEQYVDKFNPQDKFQFIGYNCMAFDDPFLRAWFKKNNENYYGSYFWWPCIDVATMAALHFMRVRGRMKNFKLMTVAKALGIDVDESQAHDGLYDIGITKQIYKFLDKNNI